MRKENDTSPNTEMVEWFAGICAQFNDMKDLRRKYEEENRVMNHTPPWKRPYGERHCAIPMADRVSTAVRFAPDIGPEEGERIWQLLPSGWFNLHSVVSLLQLTPTEVRRRFFWMGRRRLLMYNSAATMYCKREGKLKHSMKCNVTFTNNGIERRQRKNF